MNRRSFLERLSGGLAAFVAAPRLLWARWTEPTPVAQAPALPEPDLFDAEWYDDMVDSLPSDIEFTMQELPGAFTLRSWPGMLYPEQATDAQKRWAALSWDQMRGREFGEIRPGDPKPSRDYGYVAHIEGDGWEARP